MPPTPEEVQSRPSKGLELWEMITTVLFAAGFGFIGAIFLYSTCKKYKADGFVLKAKKSWRLYWWTMLLKVIFIAAMLTVAIKNK